MTVSVFLATAMIAYEVITPAFTTSPVPHDADDPAIWVCQNPGRSLILGTDKQEKTGGLYVFDLEGKIVQSLTGLDRPNNVDVEYGFRLGGKTVDLAVVTERMRKRLRVFAIDRETGRLRDVTGSTGVFKDRTDKDSVPMGVGVSRKFIAVVSPKSGPKSGYLASYRLVARNGKIDTVPYQEFGVFSGSGEIEAVCIDDQSCTVYYSDEGAGIRRTKGLFEGQPLSEIFGQADYRGDREGLAVHSKYLLSSDQIENNSRLHVYEREGLNKPVCVLKTSADQTDGIDAVSHPLGARYPNGILVMMNSSGKNFQVYDWRAVQRAIDLEPGK